jgi:hypothetical protein
MRVVGVEARAQFDPFQMKYGTAASPDPVTTPLTGGPVMALQIAGPSGPKKRMSNPFSFGP